MQRKLLIGMAVLVGVTAVAGTLVMAQRYRTVGSPRLMARG